MRLKSISIIMLLLAGIMSANSQVVKRPNGGTVGTTGRTGPFVLPPYGWGALAQDTTNIPELFEASAINTSSGSACSTPVGSTNQTLYTFSSNTVAGSVQLSVAKLTTSNNKTTYLNLPAHRRAGLKDFAVASIGSSIYLIGGRNLGGTILPFVVKYNAESGFPIDTTNNRPASIGAIAESTAVTLDGKIYTFGGVTSGNILSNKVARVDPANNPKWTSVNTFPAGINPAKKVIALGVDALRFAYVVFDTGVYKFDVSSNANGVWSLVPNAGFTAQTLSPGSSPFPNWIGMTPDGRLHFIQWKPGCDTPPNCPPPSAPDAKFFDGVTWHSYKLSVIQTGDGKYGYTDRVGITCGNVSYGNGFILSPTMITVE